MARPASLNPDEATGGSEDIPADGNYLVIGARFEVWDYNKPDAGNMTTALVLDLYSDFGGTYQRHYSSGWNEGEAVPGNVDDNGNFVSSGTDLGATGDYISILRSGTNSHRLLTEACNATSGLKERLEPRASFLVGLHGVWTMVAQERGNMPPSRQQSGQPERQSTIFVPKSIDALPWDNQAAVRAALSKKKPAPRVAAPAASGPPPVQAASHAPPVTAPPPPVAQATAEANDLMATAVELAVRVVDDPQMDHTRHAITSLVANQVEFRPVMGTLMNLVFGPEFVAELAKIGIKVEGEVLSR